MTLFKKLVAAGTLAVAVLTQGVIPLPAQVVGGDTECTITYREEIYYYGDMIIVVYRPIDKVCVTIID